MVLVIMRADQYLYIGCGDLSSVHAPMFDESGFTQTVDQDLCNGVCHTQSFGVYGTIS